MKLSFHQLSACIAAYLIASVSHASEWSVQTHDLYPGDFNGDSRTDVLYVAKDAGGMSGIALSNGAEWVAGVQSWSASGLGLQWHSNAYTPVIGDFNWDGRDDIFMHRQTPGDHSLLLSDPNGRFIGAAQTIPNSRAGLTWSGDQHRIIAIKAKSTSTANPKGHRLFLQAVAKGGTSAIIDTGPSQLIGSSTVGSAWSDGYRGFQWNLRESLVQSGDFNGDGDGDLLIQAKPQIVLIDYEIPIPVPVIKPGSFGIVYSPVSSGVTAIWNRIQSGVDWSASHSNLVIADFDGDGRDDVLVQPMRAGASTYLVRTNASTNALSLSSPVAINFSGASSSTADSYRILAANINGSSAERTFGVYLQGTAAATADLISHSLPSAGGTASTVTQSTQSQVAGQSERPYMTAVRYNKAGQVTGTIAPDPDGSGQLRYLATRNTYNSNGMLEKVESGELSVWLNETIRPADWGTYANFTIFITKEYTYDTYGRKATELIRGTNLAAESLVQYSYNSKDLVQCKAVRMHPSVYGSLPGACTQSIPGAPVEDRISQFAYNEYDQLLTEHRGVGTGLLQTYVTNTYAGKLLKSQTDANGNRTELEYTTDGLGRLWKRFYPSPTATGSYNSNDYNEYTYQNNGNVRTERKRNGTLITNDWDGNNRLTKKDLSDNSYSADVFYDYDLRGLTLHSRFGGDETSRDGVTNSFDGFGRLKTSQTKMLSTSRMLTYAYDDNSNRERVTHPDGTYFAYRFDGLNRVDRLYESSTSVLTLEYHANGTRKGITRVGGATTALVRNNAMLLGSFTQDFSGTTNDLTNSFLYNPARQVTQLTQSNTLYAYVGNANKVGAYVPNGLNQYGTIAGAATAHDLNGNMTADGDAGRTYKYDMENRLVEAASPASSFTYDPLGRLFRVTMGATTRDFLYDGDALVAEYSGSSIVRRYVHGDQVDEPWLQYNISGSTSTRRFLYSDHQGSIIAQSDAAGAVTKVTYDSYGIPGGSIDRFGYTGQIWLSELGLFHYKARMYSPKLGRFLQTDPIFYADDMNMYAYVKGDPINARDPTGLKCQTSQETGASCTVDTFKDRKGKEISRVEATAKRGDARRIERLEARMTAKYEKAQALAARNGSVTIKGNSRLKIADQKVSGSSIVGSMEKTKVTAAAGQNPLNSRSNGSTSSKLWSDGSMTSEVTIWNNGGSGAENTFGHEMLHDAYTQIVGVASGWNQPNVRQDQNLHQDSFDDAARAIK